MKTITDLTTAIIQAIKLLSHPVGSLYFSTVDTPPDQLFGGVWEPIQDTFLWCAGPKHAAGTSGGEETHTLTGEELPQHTHRLAVFTGGNDDTGKYTSSWLFT